jgi:hypothetical protein
MLRDRDDKDGIRELKDIHYRLQFDRKWGEFAQEEQNAVGGTYFWATRS